MPVVPARLPVEGDEHQQLVAMFANYCATVFDAAGWPVGSHPSPLDLAVQGNCTNAGLLAAAIYARDVLASTPQGREALSRLGFEVVAQQVEGERHA